MPMNFAKSIEEFFEREDKFHDELLVLRELFLSTELEEAFKWSIPAYCFGKKNVAGIASFKNYVGIWFHQGVFLKDDHKKLINAQEGKTKALRQWRFESLEEIEKNKKLISAYIEEAIENQKLGKELKPEKKILEIPNELKTLFKKNDRLNSAFQKLTPGKQKEYAIYISEAKRDKTKQTRLDKITPMILNEIGLNDKYK